MELRDGRGSQLEEEDTPYIVERQNHPLSTLLSPRPAVVPLQTSGTTAGAHGTTAVDRGTTAAAAGASPGQSRQG